MIENKVSDYPVDKQWAIEASGTLSPNGCFSISFSAKYAQYEEDGNKIQWFSGEKFKINGKEVILEYFKPVIHFNTTFVLVSIYEKGDEHLCRVSLYKPIPIQCPHCGEKVYKATISEDTMKGFAKK